MEVKILKLIYAMGSWRWVLIRGASASSVLLAVQKHQEDNLYITRECAKGCKDNKNTFTDQHDK